MGGSAPRHPDAPRVVRRLEMWPVESLRGFKDNPREHSAEQVADIAASIRQFGYLAPIVADERRRVILAGHARYAAALRVGLRKVPVVPIGHLSRAQQIAYVIADNRLAEKAAWNRTLLAQHAQELQALDYDVTFTGFSVDELNAMIAEAGAAGVPDESAKVPKPPAAAVSRRGDTWVLGAHRLRAGDATHIDDVVAVCSGSPVDAAGAIQNDAMGDDAFAAMLLGAFVALRASMREGAPIYVAHPDTGGLVFRRAFVEAGFKLSSCLIWRKSSLVLSRGDYHWQHEPILYGWNPGAAHRWYGGRNKTTIQEFGEPPFQQVGENEWQISIGETTLIVRGRSITVEPVRSTVFFEEKPAASPDHPTMKPVALVSRMLSNSARPGDRVLDPFAGAGSTLIACEQLGMGCCALEIDPRYVDVIVQRWQNLTGREAVLEETGETLGKLARRRRRK